MFRILFSVFIIGLSSLAPAAPKDPSAKRRLHELLKTDWERRLAADPITATYLGDTRYNGLWPDRSLNAIKQEKAAVQKSYASLLKIPRSALDEGDRLNFDLFKEELEVTINKGKFPVEFMPVGRRNAPHIMAVNLTQALTFGKAKDFKDWLARLETYDHYLAQNIVLMREGMKSGWMPSKVLMDRVIGQIEKQIVSKPEHSSFYKPFREMPGTIPPAEQEKMRSEARSLIQQKIIPALRSFQKFFVTEYYPACPTSTAVSDLPSGKEYYNHLIRTHTSTSLTADDIHLLGLKEVERLLKAMDAIKEELQFKGTRQDLFKSLRTDPKFSYKTPDELLAAYRALAKSIDPKLTKIFRKLPRTPYGVVPIPEATAPDTTTAYYMSPSESGDRPGQYFVNLYRPETRLTWEMLPLTLHEAVPGHHLQIALAKELKDLPKFRRDPDITAFVEGWALYAETLGYDMGLYNSPYERMGQLSFEMWRAVRLVVDTGLHAKGWTRSQAIDYFLENAPRPENDVINEIDRYIGDPGQALAYKIGQLKIRELREAAEAQLKDRFDLRDFHDRVLEAGPVPLTVLERRIHEWIRTQTP